MPNSWIVLAVSSEWQTIVVMALAASANEAADRALREELFADRAVPMMMFKLDNQFYIELERWLLSLGYDKRTAQQSVWNFSNFLSGFVAGQRAARKGVSFSLN